MSQENGDALGAFKSQVEGLAKDELDKLDAEIEELQERLDSLRTQQRSVRAILTAARPKEPRERGKKQGSKAGVPFKMSDERRVEFEKWLAEHGSQEFTTSTLREAFPGWAESYVSMSVRMLRDEGVIRKAAQSGTTPIYKVVA